MEKVYTNEELVDTLIKDCNDAVGAIIGGNNIKFCKLVYEMAVKLANLKSGIHAETENKNAIIEQLKQQMRNLGGDVKDVPVSDLPNITGRKDEQQ